ncbi:FAD-binding oxidoreductase [Tritonibacter litoralis]|uniref:NAD(P)/FAD-dependent oxidoreductase n=1 Tax=Tritonibacter litoralis TaxID=2662264 RepID=UPI0031B5B09F
MIILGGGLMGTATAYFLTKRGARVTLIERGQIGAGATVASFGNIRRSGRYLPQMPLANRSLALWSQLEAWLDLDVEFRPTGHLRLIFDQDGLSMMQQFRKDAMEWGLTLEVLEPKDIQRRFPGLGPEAVAASYSPDDGSANPRLIAPAFAAAAARNGARLHEQVCVSDIQHKDDGFAVKTTAGTFQADTLLNCAGAWGAYIAGHFGEKVPITLAGPQMGVTEPLPHRILPVVGVWSKSHGAYLRQVERGNVVFGGAVARSQVGEDGYAKVNPCALPTQMKEVVKLVPALREATIIRQWSGVEGYIDDMLPVMGSSHTTKRLFHAFGFCGHGFQLGPGVGDAMAELITTGTCSTPLSPFDIGRFAA